MSEYELASESNEANNSGTPAYRDIPPTRFQQQNVRAAAALPAILYSHSWHQTIKPTCNRNDIRVARINTTSTSTCATLGINDLRTSSNSVAETSLDPCRIELIDRSIRQFVGRQVVFGSSEKNTDSTYPETLYQSLVDENDKVGRKILLFAVYFGDKVLQTRLDQRSLSCVENEL
jgi:hypothetical protein